MLRGLDVTALVPVAIEAVNVVNALAALPKPYLQPETMSVAYMRSPLNPPNLHMSHSLNSYSTPLNIPYSSPLYNPLYQPL